MDLKSFSESFNCKIFQDNYFLMQNNLIIFSKNPALPQVVVKN